MASGHRPPGNEPTVIQLPANVRIDFLKSSDSIIALIGSPGGTEASYGTLVIINVSRRLPRNESYREGAPAHANPQ